jgi:translocation and assembly module TamA
LRSTSVRIRRLGLGGLIAATLGLAHPAAAADPQPYDLDFGPAANAAVDETLRATSDLDSLRKNAPVSPFGLLARARSDVDRLKTVLESFGYYQSKVLITIDGLQLADGGLGERLTALPKGSDAHVVIRFELGPLYRLRHVDIEGTVPASALTHFGLASGDPAVATSVFAAGGRLLDALHDEGYAFAKVDEPVATEDATQPLLDVSFRVETGAKVNIGTIHFAGMKRVHESLLRRRLLLRTGEQYSSSLVERARKDLAGLGVLAAVTVRLGGAVDATGGVPMTFEVKERARYALGFNTAYSSDLGGSIGSTWTDRDVFGGGEQLSLAATFIGIGGNAVTAPGYNTSVKYLLPDFGARNQSLQFAVSAIKQSLIAYDQKGVTTGVTLTRKLSSVWTVNAGVTTTNEEVAQYTQNVCPPAIPNCAADQEIEFYDDAHYTLVALPLHVIYDTTDLASPLDDPTHGMRNSVGFTPTRSIGQPSATYLISDLKLAAYFDVGRWWDAPAGRSVLAARGLVGVAQGASVTSLPPDQRFYAGGSGTIRGYEYQSVGPLFPNGLPTGGTSLLAGTLEFRQRIGKNFGLALFSDSGKLTSNSAGAPDIFRVGIGTGLRYYTPIGPVRLDFAVPLPASHPPLPIMEDGKLVSQQFDEPRFQVYIGLGQAF